MKTRHHRDTPRVLFICKNRIDNYSNSVGLINSAIFTAQKLETLGVETKVVTVVDNNGIDKEVHDYAPTHVVVEAIWVVPSKFDVLLPRYPNVVWTVRIHSKANFIANEGIAFDWIFGYKAIENKYDNFVLSSNHIEFTEELRILTEMNVAYLPNIYDVDNSSYETEGTSSGDGVLNIGCFGAMRPMKNIFIQGIAAAIYAKKKRKYLKFNVNAGRVEQSGENSLKNLRALYNNIPYAELVEHPWYSHDDFLSVIDTMDLGMQVSYTETFNIVTADFVSLRKPVVVSSEVEWVSPLFYADPNSSEDMVKKIEFSLLMGKYGAKLNTFNLRNFAKKATMEWLNWLY